MDFSAYNPQSTNALNRAARFNEYTRVRRLLKTSNPNCVDNRGWTSLHEAAANDSFESMLLILKHPDCRPLAESFEGHTALYLACKNNVSFNTIKVLLDSVEDIANYASTEMVSPLHVISMQGRTDVLQLLIDYGAIVNCQDYDGDTPLHDAAFAMKDDVVNQLLHAGADPEIFNDAMFNAFHLACARGCLNTVKAIHPFISDVNMCAGDDKTALFLATEGGKTSVVLYLLEHGADPHLRNTAGEIPVDIALTHGHSKVFSLLLAVTDRQQMDLDIVQLALKPHFFNMDIVCTLFESDLGHEFFNRFTRISYLEIDVRVLKFKYYGPLTVLFDIIEYIYNHHNDVFEKIIYLYLMRGIVVNSQQPEVWPPLPYFLLCDHANSFEAVFSIMLEHGVDVDYSSGLPIPDAFTSAMNGGSMWLAELQRHSLVCEPGLLLHTAKLHGLLGRIPQQAVSQLLAMIDINSEGAVAENITCFAPTLRHLCRLAVRHAMRATGARSTKEYIQLLEALPLPRMLLTFLRYC